jgi:hypothetical protein
MTCDTTVSIRAIHSPCLRKMSDLTLTLSNTSGSLHTSERQPECNHNDRRQVLLDQLNDLNGVANGAWEGKIEIVFKVVDDSPRPAVCVRGSDDEGTFE